LLSLFHSLPLLERGFSAKLLGHSVPAVSLPEPFLILQPMLFMKGPGHVLNKCDAAACFFNSHFVLNCFADCPRHFLAIFTNRGISECRRWARWGSAGTSVAVLFYA
jgi:hypothetical protein